MKHLAVIQTEFVKQARKWDDLTIDEQKLYLKKHPGSKRRVTAKPEKAKKLEAMTGVKRVFSRLKRLENVVNKYENNGVTRQKVYWVLEKAVNGKKPLIRFTKDPKTYNLISHYSEDKNKLITAKLDRNVNRLAQAINKLEDRIPGGQKAAMAYVKTHFLVERKVKPAKRIEDLKKAPRALKVKKMKTPDYVSVGDRVQLSNGIVMTVTGTKHGNKWFTVNGTTDEGAHWHSKQRGSSYNGMNLKFLGKTDAEDAETKRRQHRDFEQTVDTEKLKKKLSNQEKLNELDAHTGDTIQIKGSHYNWNAEVVSVDYKAGGIRINQIQKRRQRGVFFSGLGLPGNVTTHHRLIPANAIIKVVR